MNRKRTGAMGFVLAFGLAAGALAQQPSDEQPTEQQPTEPQPGEQPGGQPSDAQKNEPGLGEQPQQPGTATVPQYWIADAALFIDNAGNAASVLRKVQGLSVQDPQTIG